MGGSCLTQNSFHDFVRSRIEIPGEYKEPFCPFSPAYCDAAYSDNCYTCYIAEQDYYEQKENNT